jgi:hypothetical protein
MTDIEKKPEGGAQTVEELASQIENLNKGIASYRDKTTAAETIALEAKKEVDSFKAEIERLKTDAAKGKKGDDAETQLAPDDQKKLDAWAKQNGYITKEELEQEKGRLFNESLQNVESQAIDEFVKSHPEYDNDELWGKVKEQFAQYKQPTSITGYRNLLTKIHKELKGDSEAAAKARAAEENRKRLGLGGGSGGGSASDTTLEDLRTKYPNLSEDVIQSRLEEINSLAKAREERNKARKQ